MGSLWGLNENRDEVLNQLQRGTKNVGCKTVISHYLTLPLLPSSLNIIDEHFFRVVQKFIIKPQPQKSF